MLPNLMNSKSKPLKLHGFNDYQSFLDALGRGILLFTLKFSDGSFQERKNSQFCY